MSASHPLAPAQRLSLSIEGMHCASCVGRIAIGESGVQLNEIYPHNYAAQNFASKSREQVRSELAEAAANGQLNRHIAA